MVPKNHSTEPRRLCWPLLTRRDPGTALGQQAAAQAGSQPRGHAPRSTRLLSLGTSTLPCATHSDQQAQESDCRAGSRYLDEVRVEPSHEHSLDQFLLFAVLVTYGRGHGAVRRGRHQEGFVEVLGELLDKACGEEVAPANHPLRHPTVKRPRQGSTGSSPGGSASAPGQEETFPAWGLPRAVSALPRASSRTRTRPRIRLPGPPTPAPGPSPALQPLQGREGRSRPQRLTVDEAKAGAIQVVVLQVVIPGAAVPTPQHLLPARHSSDKGEVIAPTLPAQNSLGLGDRRAGEASSSPPSLPDFCLPPGGLLTLSTSARFCRLLLKGSRVRQETMTSRGWRQR